MGFKDDLKKIQSEAGTPTGGAVEMTAAKLPDKLPEDVLNEIAGEFCTELKNLFELEIKEGNVKSAAHGMLKKKRYYYSASFNIYFKEVRDLFDYRSEVDAVNLKLVDFGELAAIDDTGYKDRSLVCRKREYLEQIISCVAKTLKQEGISVAMNGKMLSAALPCDKDGKIK